MKQRGLAFALVAVGVGLVLGCTPQVTAKTNIRSNTKTIVVTYSLLGSLVAELAGDQFHVVTLLPNGLDPHEWEPSARDIETLNKASLVVRNGLGLEGGLEGALARAEEAGVPVFVASDHISVRTVKAGQGLPTGDADQAEGAQDPHLWLSPLAMKAIVLALAADLKQRFGIDRDAQAADLASRLEGLDGNIRGRVEALPEAKRLLVTGHESLGYFAEAYGFTLVGAIVPSLTDQAEVSASDMVSLKRAIRDRRVAVLFTELGTPPKVAQALADETGLKVVSLTTHALPADGSYFTFLDSLASTVVDALEN